MIKPNSTPGPWHLHTDTNGRVYTDHASDWLFGANGEPVIHTFPGDYEEEAHVDISDEDARLIAASPDLLAAFGGDAGRRITDRLEALIALYLTTCGPDYEEIQLIRKQIDDIKAAIAKAEGSK